MGFTGAAGWCKAVSYTHLIRLINESMPSDAVIKLKSLEAFAAAADGRATKIIIPSEIQGAAALAAGLVESVKGDAPNA